MAATERGWKRVHKLSKYQEHFNKVTALKEGEEVQIHCLSDYAANLLATRLKFKFGKVYKVQRIHKLIMVTKEGVAHGGD